MFSGSNFYNKFHFVFPQQSGSNPCFSLRANQWSHSHRHNLAKGETVSSIFVSKYWTKSELEFWWVPGFFFHLRLSFHTWWTQTGAMPSRVDQWNHCQLIPKFSQNDKIRILKHRMNNLEQNSSIDQDKNLNLLPLLTKRIRTRAIPLWVNHSSHQQSRQKIRRWQNPEIIEFST